MLCITYKGLANDLTEYGRSHLVRVYHRTFDVSVNTVYGKRRVHVTNPIDLINVGSRVTRLGPDISSGERHGGYWGPKGGLDAPLSSGHRWLRTELDGASTIVGRVIKGNVEHNAVALGGRRGGASAEPVVRASWTHDEGQPFGLAIERGRACTDDERTSIGVERGDILRSTVLFGWLTTSPIFDESNLDETVLVVGILPRELNVRRYGPHTSDVILDKRTKAVIIVDVDLTCSVRAVAVVEAAEVVVGKRVV